MTMYDSSQFLGFADCSSMDNIGIRREINALCHGLLRVDGYTDCVLKCVLPTILGVCMIHMFLNGRLNIAQPPSSLYSKFAYSSMSTAAFGCSRFSSRCGNHCFQSWEIQLMVATTTTTTATTTTATTTTSSSSSSSSSLSPTGCWNGSRDGVAGGICPKSLQQILIKRLPPWN